MKEQSSANLGLEALPACDVARAAIIEDQRDENALLFLMDNLK